MKRSELRRRKPINRMSAKRKAAAKVRIKAGPKCEICELLDGVESWEKFREPWPDAFWRIIDLHHVHNPPRSRWDDPRNVLSVCRPAHEFVQSTRIGRLVCTEMLCRLGRFDREATRAVVGRDVIALIEADYQAGIFASDAVLDGLCLLLLERF